MRVAICQADNNPEDQVLESEEARDRNFLFDMTKLNKYMCLLPLDFDSRVNTKSGQNHHRFVGEASSGVFRFNKLRHILFILEFIWVADCSRIWNFYKNWDLPTHVLQKWGLQLLQSEFTIIHGV